MNTDVPKGWKRTTIGRSLRLKSGSFLSSASMDADGQYPVYGGNGISGYHSAYMFEGRKIVLGRVGVYCGAVHHTLPYSWVTDNALYVAEKDSRFLDAYLALALHHANLNQYASQSGQPLISQSRLHDVELLIPPSSEQKRIAAILGRADRLRRLRRTARELSDTYLQSVFLEMFGDPVMNPMEWEVKPLRDISIKFQDGPFGSNLKTEHYTPSGIRVIRLQNIGVGHLIDDDKAYISESHFATLSKHKCVPGDVVVGTLGDPNLRACILPYSISVALNKADCIQVRVNPKEATPEFTCWLLNMPHTLFLATRMIHGQTRSRISMSQLAQLEVPMPPSPLQQQFDHIVHKFERLRAQQREAERQAEHLFETLLERAFSAEL